ncbi:MULTISPECIES: protease inhibitor I42 family protein [Pseudomonas]|uniref:protease inhibitor I42 family protein n=1 Tax=Pseudomonas TaxID=286 RepID=UPI000676A16F|nr:MULTISPECIES: protease inhibitor I42 family protein [Pseudomonas]KNC06354.1 peptidase inhibitor I42 [Pseudomonas sp. RIT-PI-a]
MSVVRLILPASLTLLTACAQQPRHNIELEDQSQCPVALSVGQTITLQLPTNPSTGYRWLVQNPGASVLRSLGPEVYSSARETGVIGAAGQSTWRFQARAPGDGHLMLVLQQPWAPEVPPAETFSCDITVK